MCWVEKRKTETNEHFLIKKNPKKQKQNLLLCYCIWQRRRALGYTHSVIRKIPTTEPATYKQECKQTSAKNWGKDTRFYFWSLNHRTYFKRFCQMDWFHVCKSFCCAHHHSWPQLGSQTSDSETKPSCSVSIVQCTLCLFLKFLQFYTIPKVQTSTFQSYIQYDIWILPPAKWWGVINLHFSKLSIQPAKHRLESMQRWRMIRTVTSIA